MWKLRYKVPIGFTYTVRRHIDNIEIKVKKPEEKEEEWREAIVEKELLESWGGYYKDCGGARYRLVIKAKDDPVAVGEYSYQACVPTVPFKNYAITELKFITPCDVRLTYGNVEITFFVRYLNEFLNEFEA